MAARSRFHRDASTCSCRHKQRRSPRHDTSWDFQTCQTASKVERMYKKRQIFFLHNSSRFAKAWMPALLLVGIFLPASLCMTSTKEAETIILTSGYSSIDSSNNTPVKNSNAASGPHRKLLTSQLFMSLDTTFSGVNDLDHSPTLPDSLITENANLDKISKDLDARLQKSDKDKIILDTKMKGLQEIIVDDLRDVKEEVRDDNKKLSDEISAVPETVGPPGVPGLLGPPGLQGSPGTNGEIGLQGPPGRKGLIGVVGPPGGQGPRGPHGLAGPIGKFGPEGIQGVTGQEGAVGREGKTRSWSSSLYFCPEGRSETMRLMDCSQHGCRLEVLFEDEWGTVCSSGINEAAGNILCKDLGFSMGGKLVPSVGGGQGVIWLDEVKCIGDEGDIGDCKHAPWGEVNCVHGDDLGLCCNGAHPDGKVGKRIGPSSFPRCPSITKKDMRLVDCNREVCRLEVNYNNTWGTVCDNGFTDTNAVTICKLMGFPNGKFKEMCATQGRWGSCKENTEGAGPIWLDDVVCLGFERDLEGCRHRPWGEHRCTHRQDVGICCSGTRGDFVVPGKCRHGEMDFKFNENLESSTGGPDLSAPWGGSFDGVNGYRFKEGQGLGMDPNGCVGPNSYTIYLNMELDQTIGERKLVHSNGWEEAGLYVKNNNLMILPENAKLVCDQTINPNEFNQVVMTRDPNGLIRLFINGALCGEDTSSDNSFLALNPDDIMFLADYGLKNPSGHVKRIRVFGKALSEDEVAKICNCRLTERDKPCNRHIEMNAALPGIAYSSVKEESWRYCANEGGVCACSGEVRYGARGVYKTLKSSASISCSNAVFGDPVPGIGKICECLPKFKMGQGYASGRMNSPQAWTAKVANVDQWMQMDTGSVQSIAGVITQGRRDADEWVTSYSVQVSQDGKDWISVGCGRIWAANTDRNSKARRWFHEPVKARYIRILPKSWFGDLSMRAGVIVCERPCMDGELNYMFPLSFISSTQGPPLDATWGEGEFEDIELNNRAVTVYEFNEGEGFQLDQRRCLKGALAWTILIDVKLDSVDGYKRILGSEGWGDYGLYVNTRLMLVPRNSHMICSEKIRTTKFYKFVMTRDEEGKVKLYVNGALCASGSPPYKDHFQLNPDNIMILRDDANENAGGYVKNIHIWNKALVEKDVESVCECTLPDLGDTCTYTVVFNPPSARTSYSSVWNKDQVGKGHARGRLGSKQGWSAARANVEEFMQIDTGFVQSISGIVTQGRHDADEWVESFSLQVSTDGSEWKDVGCGTEFDANTDRNTKVKNIFKFPVKARYVRIYPQSWHNWISMRAGLLLCEKPCKDGHLEYDFTGVFASKTNGPSLDPAWGDGDFDDELGYRFMEGEGLELDASRCLQNPDSWSMVIRVRLDDVNGYRAIMTSEAWGDGYGLYVDKYLQLAPIGANLICEERRINPNKFYYFAITRSPKGRITLYLDGAECASSLELFKDHYHLDTSKITFLRDESGKDSGGYVKNVLLWGKLLDKYEVASYCDCLLPPTAESTCDKLVEYTAIAKKTKYSSVFQNSPVGTGYARGRLNSRAAWQAATNALGEWMEIDTGRVQTIAGIVTQGSKDQSAWVTTYYVKVSDDGYEWKDVRCRWELSGNTDQNTKVRNRFQEPVIGRYVRIYPTTWSGKIAMRAGILLCMNPCSNGELYYELGKESLLSSTDGPGLETPWGSGYFTGDGYRFLPGQGFEIDENEELCMNDHKNITASDVNTAYTISMTVKFDSTSSWVRLISSTGWGDDGVYINKKYQIFPPGANMKCAETIRPGVWYQFGITRTAKGVLGLYINGGKCAKGRPGFSRGLTLDPHELTFFHDDGNENSAGEVKEIHLWNKALSETEMADYSGCELNEVAPKCPRTIAFSPTYLNMKFSSVLGGSIAGIGFGRGRLNSPQAWVPQDRPGEEEYLQFDIGETQSVAGVVTQGRRDDNQWVTAFSVLVSTDEVSWVPAFCGEVFDANSDRNTKVKTIFRRPVLARFVRIIPQTWYGRPALRAGVLICEHKCIAGTLDYRLQTSFLSATDGPALNPAWGEGSFDNINLGYRFDAGQGFTLDESVCIPVPENITILLDVTLDTTSGYQNLIGSDGWGNYGFYVNKQFQAYPPASQLKCSENIIPGVSYKYIFSRSSDGSVRLYLNGYLCSEGVPPFVQGYLPDPTSLIFLHNDDGWNTGGYVKKIKVWNRALSKEEAARESECFLSQVGKTCNATVVLVPSYSRMKYSSVWGGYPMGGFCATGRLGSSDGWCASSSQIGEYLQIDTGSIQSIQGVVSQGRGNSWQWVASYKVSVSVDGLHFSQVQCGRVFDANTDMDTQVQNIFDAPVIGRYVRIMPQTWYSWMSMRAAVLVCEQPCESAQLDYQLLDDLLSTTNGPNLNAPWGYNDFNPNLGYRFWGGRGLQLDESTCLNGQNSWTILVEVSLDWTTGSAQRLIGSKGWGSAGVFVSDRKFTVLPGVDVQCKQLLLANVFYRFVVSRSTWGDVSLYVNGYKCAAGNPSFASGLQLNAHDIHFFHDDGNQNAQGYVKHIEVWGKVLSDATAARVSGCTLLPPANTLCNSSFGYSPPDSSYKYSTSWNNEPPGVGHGRGRLNSPQAWSVGWNTNGNYMQIDVGQVTAIAGVVTQGRQDYPQWVTLIQVTYSTDGKRWFQVQCGETFPANSDMYTKAIIQFDFPIDARYIRIWPIEGYNWLSMRAGVLMCEMQCKDGALDYRMKDTLVSSTQGPALLPQWGEGYFDTSSNKLGYRFGAGQGFNLNAVNCLSGFDYTMIIEARFDDTSRWIRLLSSSPWGDFGLYVRDQKYMLYPRSLGMSCQGAILPGFFYKFGLSRTLDGRVILYLNGYPCITKKPALANHFAIDTSDITFLHDEGNDNGAGYVRRIRVWSQDFSDDDMASINECVPAEETEPCTRTVVYNAPYSNIEFSSIWAGDPVGWRHGSGRLDSYQGWSAWNWRRGEYMQIDTGSVQKIAGVVTQMRGDWYWQVVTAFSVAVSEDGDSWYDVQCGTTFDGNHPNGWGDKDVKLFTRFNKPVKGRYVQIIIQDWVGHPSMRAGVLICEVPCTGGTLDYPLAGDMMSTTNGPALESIGGGGDFTGYGYRYSWGQGLKIDQASCISDPSTYSIILNVRLDNTDTWNRLVYSDGWGRYGLFVQGGKFEFFPVDLGLVCPGMIQPNVVYQLGMTHTSDAEVKLYVNGWMCATGLVFDAPKQLNLAPDDLEFFKDPNNLNYYGYVSRVRVWNKVLSESEMMTAMNCKLPEDAKKTCSSYVVKNVPYSQMRFDSVYGNYAAGQYYGRGRLNDDYGWLSPDYEQGHWIQLDLGQVLAVAGVVTQGMSWGWYTTSFYVKVSKDGRKWASVECGRTFPGNNNWWAQVQTIFTTTVSAQFVRIYPQTFYGYANMRAGALVCEVPCTGGKLDYNFQQSFESSTEGPSLALPWGQGNFDQNAGYYFSAGQGLQIPKVGTCVTNPKTYSLIINVRLAYAWWSWGPLSQNYYSLFTSQEWGDAGLYVNSVLTLKPPSISCAEVIRAQYYYQFGMTRGADGTVTLYMNGYPCASGTPPYKKGYSLPTDMTFFNGINSQNSAGYVKEIRVWDTTLSAADMATQSGCDLNTEKDTCNGLVVLNVPYTDMMASTVWGGGSIIGSFWGQAQLDSNAAWIPNDWSAGKMWLQLDTGKVQTIAGIVTQGCGYYGYYWWYVASFWVQISDDGASWNYVECGRIFVGNTDWNSKVNTMFAKPVQARYIRILPESYNGYPALRAGVLVCESECSDHELHYDLDNGFSSSTGGPSLKVPWGQGYFSDHKYYFSAGQGLKVDEKSCISASDQYSILMRVNLQNTNSWAALFTSAAWGDSGLYVNSKYQLKGGNLVCKNEPIRAGYWYQYGIVRSKTGTVDLYLNGYKCASGSPSLNGGFALSLNDMTFFHGINGQSSAGSVNNIHVWGKTLSESDMRSESGCTLPEQGTDRCSSQVALMVPYSQITASTVYAGYTIGQGSYYGQPYLNSPTSWLAYNWDLNQWLQYDVGEIKLIAGVVTQGSANWYAWTTMYKVLVSVDGSTWNYVECGRIFDANSDMNTKVKNIFDYPVKAQFVRINPVGYYNYITMRAALLVCETQCDDGTLDYQMEQTFTSSTNGPSLSAQWGEGYFRTDNIRSSLNAWSSQSVYYFSRGQGLTINQKSCLTETGTYSVLIHSWMSDVSGWEALMTSQAWRDTGLYIKNNLFLKGTTLQCEERIRTAYYYQIGMTRDSDGTVTLYLNGYPCASGSPSESDGFSLDKRGMTFFRSPNGDENSAGSLVRLRMWSTAVSSSMMAEYSGCSLPEAGSQCSGLIELNVPYDRITASSVWYGYGISSGWGQAQLDSQGSWAPAYWDQNQWLQLDTGSIQMIAGVVTQGSGNYWGYWAYYVNSFWVKVSKDGISWTYVECGRIFDTFTGSQYYQAYYTKIRTQFSQPVKARYVRIMPEGWVNGVMMRAGVLVCEPECTKGELKYEMGNTLASTTGGPSLTSPWGYGDFQNMQPSWWQPVTGLAYNFYTTRGGLQVQQSACIKSTEEYTVLMQAQVSNVNSDKWLALFTTNGWNNDGLYLHNNFQLKPTTLSCKDETIRSGYFYWFGMSRTKKGVITLYLNGYRCATSSPDQHEGYTLPKDDMMFFHGATTDQTPQGTVKEVRVFNKVISEDDIRKITSCALPAEGTTQCSNYIVLNVPVQYYSASSFGSYGAMYDHYYCASPRLDTRYSWCPSTTWQQQWLQIDTGEIQSITGVVTQGYMYGSYWVTTFRVRVSKDGAIWKDVECGRIFDGNTDYNTKKRVPFAKAVEARYVQILPLTWYNYPMLRAGVMICEKECVDGHLDYRMRDFRSSTGGPDIDAPWGQGDFVPFKRDLNHDYAGSDIQYYSSMSFDDCEKTCEADEKCGMVLLYNAQGSGCWIKWDYGTIQGRGRTTYNGLTAVFHIDTLMYRLLAPVGYQFDGGEGLRLDAATCISSTTDYSILIDAMLKNVGDGLKRIMTSKGWGDKGVYLNNQMIGLFPSASGLQCRQTVLPFYNFKFGMTRTKSGEIKLYVNGLLCASGFPKYANGYVLNPHDIKFFYDENPNYQERGWIRRIQVWDSPLSDSDMSNASDCQYKRPLPPCEKGTQLFAAMPSDIDFSSTLNRDDFGTGYAQGYRVTTTPFRNTEMMRNAGQKPPECARSKLYVIVREACAVKNFFRSKSATFDQVREVCNKNGGEVATLNSAKDLEAASNVCPGWCYIGLVRDTPSKPWRWLDNTSVTFTNWENGQPQNTETKVVGWYGRYWHDWGTGDSEFSAVCQTGSGGWNNFTGEDVYYTAKLFPGSYGTLSNEGYCDDSANMCTISNCRFNLADLSSMIIPEGLTVILFDQTWFQGNSKAFIGPLDVGCLVADGWNDRARSMKVVKTGASEVTDNEIGFWTPQYLSNQAWQWPLGEWMQIDLRKKQNISHVVTSGFEGYYRPPASILGSVTTWWYYNWEVTLFMLRVSNDAETWTDVECGRLFQIPWVNKANVPVVTNLSAPVEARFIRLYPLAWQNAIGLKMQVGVCS